MTLYAFGSWNQSKIKDNIQIGKFGTGVNQVTDCDNVPAGAAIADVIRSCAFTKGNYKFGFAEVFVRWFGRRPLQHLRAGRNREADRPSLRFRHECAHLLGSAQQPDSG